MSTHAFRSLELSGTPVADALRLPLGPGLTYLVGPSGAFKTTLMHLGRGASGAPPPVHPERRADYLERVDFALGDGTATVRVVTAQGAEYASSVRRGEAPIVTGEGGDERPGVSLDGELFSCQFFAPLEIEGIAKSKDALLALLDRFEDAEMKRVEAEIAQVERRFLDSAGELRRLAAELADDAERTAELPQIEEALRGMQRAGGPDAAAVARAHGEKTARGRERLAIDELQKDLAAVRAAMGELAKGALARIGRGVDASLENGAHGDVFRRAHAAAQRGAAALEEAARRAHDALAGAEREVAVEGKALAALHAKEDVAYTALMATEDAGHEQAAARERVQKQYDALALVKKHELARREAHAAKHAETRRLFDERARLLARRWSIRAGIMEKINGGAVHEHVRVEIRRARDTRAWREILAAALKGSRTSKDLVKAIAKSVSPAELAEAARADDPQPIASVDQMVTGKRERARKILKFLRDAGRLEELEIAHVGDLATVKLKLREGDRPTGKLSSGQACISILVVILLLARGPVVIDEPETSLDRNYINTVLVPALRLLKQSVQIVLISHHASLIVLSEPDRIVALTGEGGKASVERSGTLDEMRDVVEGIDGGREAFLLRARLYGHRVGQ